MSDLNSQSILDLRDLQAELEERTDADVHHALKQRLEACEGPPATLFDPGLNRTATALWDLKRTSFPAFRLLPMPCASALEVMDFDWGKEAGQMLERSILRSWRLQGEARPVRRVALVCVHAPSDSALVFRQALERLFGPVEFAVFTARRSPMSTRLGDLAEVGDTFDLIAYLVTGDGAERDFLSAAAQWPGLVVNQVEDVDRRVCDALSYLCWATISTMDDLKTVLPDLIARTQAHADLYKEIGASIVRSRPSAASMIAIAEQMALTRHHGRGRILFDVTEIARQDLGTGIQRVAREILRHLQTHIGGEMVVEPVRLLNRRHGPGMESMPRYRDRLYGWPPSGLDDQALIEPGADDIILCVDVNLRGVTDADRASLLSCWRARGAKLVFVVHDLLPLEMPDHFPDDLPPLFALWLKAVVASADLVLSTSRWGIDAVAQRLPPDVAGQSRPRLGFFPLGAEKSHDAEAAPSNGVSWFINNDQAQELMILAVGSVEPRKSHREILAAFTPLWQGGEEARLVIVGREGWKVAGLATEIRNHAEYGHKLIWFDEATDADLDALLRRADGLLMASKGEGFGLPVVEALVRQIPVLARRLPIFEEIAGGGIAYFESEGNATLVELLPFWLADLRARTALRPDGNSIDDWSGSCAKLVEQMRIAGLLGAVISP